MAINLSLSKLPWHGQLGVFAALGLAAVGVFWHWYAAPAQASIDARRAELATVQATIDRAQATAARLPEFRAEVAELEAQLQRLRTVLPEERDVDNLLRRLVGMATESNLVIRTFTPQAEARQQLHAEWPINLQLEGTYHDLGRFLERVSKFPRIINVNSIRIRTRDGARAGVTIVAECTAMTFVLLESATAPGAATPPAARTE